MTIEDELKKVSVPLQNEDDLAPLISFLQDKKIVLLGEASHGTAEYYLWRAAITKKLIDHCDVSFVGVEGDWPDTYRVNRYVKSYPHSEKNAREVLHAYSRWPTWMWANTEMIDFIEWLHDYNRILPEDEKIGFYGMDVYSLWSSMEEVVSYLKKIDPAAAKQTKEAYRCFDPYHKDEQQYALKQAFVPDSCESEVLRVLRQLPKYFAKYPDDREGKFNADQNAFVTVQAEKYYRTMLKGDVSSWNLRDTSMVDMLDRLDSFYHHTGKMIIWAHNTHVGDARYTDMEQVGMVNIGQLLRMKYGEDQVGIVGFGTYEGSVIAAEEWGSPMQVMLVPKAMNSSWEAHMHESNHKSRLFLFADTVGKDGLLQAVLGQRAIGVVYDPKNELGNYVPTQLSRRYDAFLFFDKTHALYPLHIDQLQYPVYPETYPTAL